MDRERSRRGVVASAVALTVLAVGVAVGDASWRELTAESLRDALGSCEGDPRYDARLDLDGSGCIDSADVHRLLHGDVRKGGEGGVAGSQPEIIVIEDRAVEAVAGGSAVVRLRLKGGGVPLFGYSAAVRAVPLPGATGTVTANVAVTNFFPSRHLILQAPGNPPMHPLFSVIVPWGQGGVFINANTADGSAVLAEPEVNDILAEVHFAVSPAAHGTFEVVLGPPSALADAAGQSVPFASCLARISVGVPAARVSDLNGDGLVDGVDLAFLLCVWGPCGDDACSADLDCDRMVDSSDLAVLLAEWS